MKKLFLLLGLFLSFFAKAQTGSQQDYIWLNNEIKLLSATSGNMNDSIVVRDASTGKFYQIATSRFATSSGSGYVQKSDSNTLFITPAYLNSHTPGIDKVLAQNQDFTASRWINAGNFDLNIYNNLYGDGLILMSGRTLALGDYGTDNNGTSIIIDDNSPAIFYNSQGGHYFNGDIIINGNVDASGSSGIFQEFEVTDVARLNEADITSLFVSGSANLEGGAVIGQSGTQGNIRLWGGDVYYTDIKTLGINTANRTQKTQDKNGTFALLGDNLSSFSNDAAFITKAALSATSPLHYNSTTGAFTIDQASGSQAGYLSATDWNTFNGKLSSYTETDPVFVASTVHGISNGTGLLKNNGSGTWTYDNNTYYLASNPSNYITGSYTGFDGRYILENGLTHSNGFYIQNSTDNDQLQVNKGNASVWGLGDLNQEVTGGYIALNAANNGTVNLHGGGYTYIGDLEGVGGSNQIVLNTANYTVAFTSSNVDSWNSGGATHQFYTNTGGYEFEDNIGNDLETLNNDGSKDFYVINGSIQFHSQANYNDGSYSRYVNDGGNQYDAYTQDNTGAFSTTYNDQNGNSWQGIYTNNKGNFNLHGNDLNNGYDGDILNIGVDASNDNLAFLFRGNLQRNGEVVRIEGNLNDNQLKFKDEQENEFLNIVASNNSSNFSFELQDPSNGGNNAFHFSPNNNISWSNTSNSNQVFYQDLGGDGNGYISDGDGNHIVDWKQDDENAFSIHNDNGYYLRFPNQLDDATTNNNLKIMVRDDDNNGYVEGLLASDFMNWLKNNLSGNDGEQGPFVFGDGTDNNNGNGTEIYNSHEDGVKLRGDIIYLQGNVELHDLDGTYGGNITSDGLSTTGGIFFSTKLSVGQQYAAPTTGSTVTSNGNHTLVLNPSGTLLALTIKFDPSPVNGQIFEVTSTQAITTVTLNGNGNTVLGGITTLAANAFAGWIYNSTVGDWVRNK